MRRIIPLLLLLLLLTIPQGLSAATRTEVNVLEAAENIRYLSQEITKKYLYLLANPKKGDVKTLIQKDLEELVANIRTISVSTSSEDTRNILEFMIYSKDQVEELIGKEPNKERAALMLDYSETLLEGANSIANEYKYQFTESEKMLILGKQMEFLLERSSKYYMALGVGLGNELNHKQMEEALAQLEKDLHAIENYPYPTTMQKSKQELRQAWGVTKGFFDRRKELFVSNLVVLSTDEMERLTGRFINFHRKTK